MQVIKQGTPVQCTILEMVTKFQSDINTRFKMATVKLYSKRTLLEFSKMTIRPYIQFYEFKNKTITISVKTIPRFIKSGLKWLWH